MVSKAQGEAHLGWSMDVIVVARLRYAFASLDLAPGLHWFLSRSCEIEHVIDILPEAMVDKVLIAAGYGIEQMREHFASLMHLRSCHR